MTGILERLVVRAAKVALGGKAGLILGHAFPYSELIEQMHLIAWGYEWHWGHAQTGATASTHEKSPACCQAGLSERVFTHFT
jgi:hypothetical protein